MLKMYKKHRNDSPSFESFDHLSRRTTVSTPNLANRNTAFETAYSNFTITESTSESTNEFTISALEDVEVKSEPMYTDGYEEDPLGDVLDQCMSQLPTTMMEQIYIKCDPKVEISEMDEDEQPFTKRRKKVHKSSPKESNLIEGVRNPYITMDTFLDINMEYNEDVGSRTTKTVSNSMGKSSNELINGTMPNTETKDERRKRLQRERQQRYRSNTTEKQLEAIRKTNAEAARLKRLQETPEQTKRRRELEAARRARARSQETPEQTELRRQLNALRQAKSRSLETPEQTELRRRKEAARQAKARSMETPEQTELRRQQEAERQAKSRSMETPEQTELRRQQEAARQAKARSMETPEQTELRRQQEAERQTKSRSQETPEQTELHCQQEAERQAKLRPQETIFQK